MKKYLGQIILLVAAFALVILSLHLYSKHQSAKNFIEFVTPLIEERDTTHSLRNYEVLSDSINKAYKDWLEDDTSK